MIKAIFFDIDSTLVSHTKNEVSASTRQALALLEQKGIARVIATGRHLSELPTLPLRDLEFDGYITLNGQLCYDRNRVPVGGNPIVGAEKDTLLRLFTEGSVPLMLIEAHRMYVNFLCDRVRQAQASVNAQVPEVGQYTGGTVYQAVAFVEPAEKAMLTELLPGCQVTCWTELAVDIVPKSAGKVSGIRQYLDRTGIPLSETMAFGDGENDTDMLRLVNIGVAMGNAEAHVKQAADYVTDHIDRDGIYKALKHFEVI